MQYLIYENLPRLPTHVKMQQVLSVVDVFWNTRNVWQPCCSASNYSLVYRTCTENKSLILEKSFKTTRWLTIPVGYESALTFESSRTPAWKVPLAMRSPFVVHCNSLWIFAHVTRFRWPVQLAARNDVYWQMKMHANVSQPCGCAIQTVQCKNRLGARNRQCLMKLESNYEVL